MGSIIETIQKRKLIYKDELPLSHSDTTAAEGSSAGAGLRRRISSFSVRIRPVATASSAWAFRKSKSMSSLRDLAGGPIRRWWDWSWGWILSRKPGFSRDLEMNEEESAALGCGSRGSLKHLFYKLRSEVRRMRAWQSSHTLPTTSSTAPQRFRYDSFSYAQNFDDSAVRQGIDE